MAASQPIYDMKSEQQLMLDLWSPEIADDPRNFVRYVYPWGRPNTPLATRTGPRQWQDQVFKEVSDYIKAAKDSLSKRNELPVMFKKAIASGRGPGKSALYGMFAHFLVSTRLGSSVWVAANGEPQLKTKTFPEISKWVSMAVNAHWFDINATNIVPAKWFSDMVQRDLKIDPKYWYIQAQLWSEENPDAFAGAHNVYGECYLFDEASGIPPAIWTVARGVFTEQIVDRYHFAFSNPRRNDGAFYDCFHKNASEWRPLNIDIRQVEDMALDEAEAIIKEFGPDSDEARVEVYGLFPNQDTNQFISFSMVEDAIKREIVPDPGAPLLMGVDVARSLERDASVIAYRKGRDARVLPWKSFRSKDMVDVASMVAEEATTHKVDAIFVDGNGVGGGVCDMLKAWGYRVIEVQAGEGAKDDAKYKNKRAELWGLGKVWLPTAALPNRPKLKADLAAPWFKFDPRTNQLVIESKEEMLKNRSIKSTDEADALLMTFAQPVARNDYRASRTYTGGRARVAPGTDRAIFS